jgi:hypothetical protein
MLGRTKALFSLAGLLVVAAPLSAQVTRLGPGGFTAAASVITFSEYALNTVNPTYNFNALPGIGDMTVSFAGSFVGQTVTGTTVRTISGTPSGPLALNALQSTFIRTDVSNPTSPVLSGDPIFNGPISVLFSADVAAVGLDGGFFDDIGSTSIQAFRRDGSVIGSVVNTITGIEFFGLASATGDDIAGISFYITGRERAGFAIDNLTFGARSVVVGVPEPSSIALSLLGLVSLTAVARRRRFNA